MKLSLSVSKSYSIIMSWQRSYFISESGLISYLTEVTAIHQTHQVPSSDTQISLYNFILSLVSVFP